MSNSHIDSLDVFRMCQSAIAQAGSQAAWARKHGVSRQYVGQVLAGRIDPSSTMLDEIGVEIRRSKTYHVKESAHV